MHNKSLEIQVSYIDYWGNYTSENDIAESRKRCTIWRKIRKIAMCSSLSAGAVAACASAPGSPQCILLGAAAVACWRRPCKRF